MIPSTTSKKLPACSAFAVLLALRAFGLVVQSQTGTSGIRGRALDPQAKEVPGARMTLSEESDKVTRSQIATASGEFFFSGLLPGNPGK
jgi:hypothetical protein